MCPDNFLGYKWYNRIMYNLCSFAFISRKDLRLHIAMSAAQPKKILNISKSKIELIERQQRFGPHLFQ